jgi:hypothetical protein
MASQTGYSFAPTFDGAEQAKTTPSPAQGSVQTLSFQLPAQKQGGISPLVSQQYGGGVNSAVLEAALRSVFGPQAQTPQATGAPQPSTPQAGPAQMPAIAQGLAGAGSAPQFMGHYDVPSFNGVGYPGGGSQFDSPDFLQYLEELDRARQRRGGEGEGFPRIHVENDPNTGVPYGVQRPSSWT